MSETATRGVWSSRKLTRRYNSRLPVYERLEREASFILRGLCSAYGDRVYSVKSRIKTLESVSQKAQRDQVTEPLDGMHDIVGLRVVCLYRSDLAGLRASILDSFQVREVDDKAGSQGDPSVFAYESVHFTAVLPATCGGPRYEGLADQPFEIQLRTLAMDIWATISHDLSYKKAWDIPAELERDFHAIAALLHLADKHFDDVYRHVVRQQEAVQTALRAAKPRLQKKVSPYSVAAYLQWKLPDRRHVRDDSVGEFSQALLTHGIRTLGELDHLVDSGLPAVIASEQDFVTKLDEPGTQLWWWDLAVARRAIRSADPSFEANEVAQEATALRMAAAKSMPIPLDVFAALVESLESEPSALRTCQGSLERTRAYLSTASEVDVEAAVQWLEEYGGYCDCEVLYNVAPLVERRV